MAHKARINDKIYYFNIWPNSRGDCMKCGDRGSCILIRTMSTKNKRSLRICHSCLMKYFFYLEGVAKRVKKAQERIVETRAKLATAKKRIRKDKKKDERILPKVLANVKSNVPPPAKKDGQDRNTSGGAGAQTATA